MHVEEMFRAKASVISRRVCGPLPRCYHSTSLMSTDVHICM